MDSPLQPSPDVRPWLYTFQPSGRSLATFLGDVLINGSVSGPTAVRGYANPLDYGAAGNGVTDDTAALLAASSAAQASGGALLLTPGKFQINGAVSLAAPAVLQPGAILQGGPGASLAFASSATILGAGQVFAGNLAAAGAVSFTGYPPDYAKPEWWGALNNTPAADCSPPIMAALACGCKRVGLTSADYWLATQLVHNAEFVELFGVSDAFVGAAGQATRLIDNRVGGLGPAVQIGPSSPPSGGINNFPQGLVARDFYVNRNAPSIAATPGAEWTTGTVGVALQYALGARLTRIKTAEFGIGFAFAGDVASRVDDCVAFRSLPSSTKTTGTITGSINGNTLTVTAASLPVVRGIGLSGGGAQTNTTVLAQLTGTAQGAGTYLIGPAQTSSGGFTATYDPFWGFALNGAINIGLAGGNASTYLDRCNASVGGNPVTLSIGANLPGLYQDTFLRDFETSNVGIGEVLSGSTTAGNGNYDFETDHHVLDQCFWMGVLVENSAPCSLNITNGYIANQGTWSPYGMMFNNIEGAVTVSNNEILGQFLTTVNVNNCKGLRFFGNRYFEVVIAIWVASSQNCYFADTTSNDSYTSANAAYYCSASNYGLKFECILKGKSGAFTQGINWAGTSTSYSTVEMTGIDRNCLTGGAAAKMICNGASIATVGAFNGTCYASGVMT